MVTLINRGSVSCIFCLNIAQIIEVDNSIYLFNTANLVLKARSEINDAEYKDYELFWSTGARMIYDCRF